MDLRIDGCVYIEKVNGIKNFLHILQDGIVNVARKGYLLMRKPVVPEAENTSTE